MRFERFREIIEYSNKNRKYMDENDVMITERYDISKVARYGRVIITYLKPKGLEE